MAGVKTIEVLRAARKLVVDENTWAQGSEALTGAGQYANPRCDEAAKWCAIGAIHRFAPSDFSYYGSDLDRALDVLASRRGYYNIVIANDNYGQAAVIEIFDDAIAELEAQQ